MRGMLDACWIASLPRDAARRSGDSWPVRRCWIALWTLSNRALSNSPNNAAWTGRSYPMRNANVSWMRFSTNDRRPRPSCFDTNILVSAHFWKGPPYRCLLAVEAGLAILVLSEPILSELGEKLMTKFAIPKAETDSIVERLRACAEFTQIEAKSGWVADPDDDSSSRRRSRAARGSLFQATVTFSVSAASKV